MKRQLPTKDPEVVYHYTTVDTMMKIVEPSPSVWATSIDYLNDTSEGDHFLKLARKRIPDFVKSYTIQDSSVFSDLIAKDYDSRRHLNFATRPFVASFSSDGNALPQWRAYCPNGNGVAIGFRVDCLKRGFIEGADAEPEEPGLSQSPMVTFLPVEYVDSSCVEVLDSEIRDSINAAVSLADEEDNSVAIGSSGYFKLLMERIAYFKKDSSFKNESEYRLLVDGFSLRWDLLQFRSVRSTLIPYVRVSIPKRHSRAKPKAADPIGTSLLADRADFIDRVVVGPTPNECLTADAVNAFFHKNNMNVEVVCSGIPYREW